MECLALGDRVVGTASGSQSWGSPQDVKLTLQYPKSGVGAVVTFIQIPVEQVNTFFFWSI